jgi:hypothetical protein
MKKIIALVICICCIPVFTFSQEDKKEKKNDFRLEMLHFIGSTFYAEYERSLCGNKAMNIVIAPTAIDNEDKQMYGIYVQVNPKFYYLAAEKEHNVQFLYFSPYAAFRYFDIKNIYSGYYDPWNPYPTPQVITEKTFIASSAGAGMLFGYKIVAGNFFILNFEAGGGIRYVFNKSGNSDYEEVNGGFNNWNLGYSGIYPRFNLTMGFKF